VVGVDHWAFFDGRTGSTATGYDLLLVVDRSTRMGRGAWAVGRIEAGLGYWAPRLTSTRVIPTISLSATVATGRPLHR
jgi:hypothetical protein